MKARIEFRVVDEDEFERYKEACKLPQETWTLIKEEDD